MPRLSVLMIHTSLIYLLIGSTFGGLMLANKGILIAHWIWSLLPFHMEFTLLGWMLLLTMGVAFWILPRFSHGAPRGDERLSWLAFYLINLGIILVVAKSFLEFDWLSFSGRSFEALGTIAFVIGNWKRIRAIGTSS
jgi:hypothetical protein